MSNWLAGGMCVHVCGGWRWGLCLKFRSVDWLNADQMYWLTTVFGGDPANRTLFDKHGRKFSGPQFCESGTELCCFSNHIWMWVVWNCHNNLKTLEKQTAACNQYKRAVLYLMELSCVLVLCLLLSCVLLLHCDVVTGKALHWSGTNKAWSFFCFVLWQGITLDHCRQNQDDGSSLYMFSLLRNTTSYLICCNCPQTALQCFTPFTR